jgi:uncharacterized OB-fold protein
MAFLNPSPHPSPDSREFWDGANRGVLLVRTCEECGKAHWYPRPHCPFCFSDRTAWREASGRGEIYSWSYMRRAAEPYVIAYVTLEEGPTMMTNIVDCDPDLLTIGKLVEVVFRRSADGTRVPLFRPAADRS